jgi:hypothetical protein
MKIFQMTACAAVLSTSVFAQQASTPAAQHPATTASHTAASDAPSIPPPANPITPAQIQEMEQVTGVKDMQKRIVSSAMQYYRSQFPPFMPQDVLEDLTKSLENADLNAQAKTVYPKYISTEDAAKIIEFYKTPTGQRMIAAQPAMMTEMQRSAVQIAQQTARDVIERHKPEIEAAQQKYVQEHQQQTKPSLSTPAPSSPSSTPAPASPSTPQGSSPKN